MDSSFQVWQKQGGKITWCRTFCTNRRLDHSFWKNNWIGQAKVKATWQKRKERNLQFRQEIRERQEHKILAISNHKWIRNLQNVCWNKCLDSVPCSMYLKGSMIFVISYDLGVLRNSLLKKRFLVTHTMFHAPKGKYDLCDFLSTFAKDADETRIQFSACHLWCCGFWNSSRILAGYGQNCLCCF